MFVVPKIVIRRTIEPKEAYDWKELLCEIVSKSCWHESQVMIALLMPNLSPALDLRDQQALEVTDRPIATL